MLMGRVKSNESILNSPRLIIERGALWDERSNGERVGVTYSDCIRYNRLFTIKVSDCRSFDYANVDIIYVRGDIWE